MKKLHWTAGIIASLAVIIILLISAFQAAMYLNFDVYQKEYEKYDVLSDLDMKMEDVMGVTEEMMAYLTGDRPELSVITTVEGQEQDFFNEQDRFHMEEVQGLFIGGLRLRMIAASVLVVCIIFLMVMKANLWEILSKCYQITLGSFMFLIALLGIAVARDFTAVFIKFHEIFFDNDLWIFDPATDYMIRMLPEGLFFDMVVRIGVYFIAGLMVTLVVSIFAGKCSVGKSMRESVHGKN